MADRRQALAVFFCHINLEDFKKDFVNYYFHGISNTFCQAQYHFSRTGCALPVYPYTVGNDF